FDESRRRRRPCIASVEPSLLCEGIQDWMEQTFYDLLMCPCPHLGQKVVAFREIEETRRESPFPRTGCALLRSRILPNTLSCMAKVLIILGSKSDMEYAETCAKQLEE